MGTSNQPDRTGGRSARGRMVWLLALRCSAARAQEASAAIDKGTDIMAACGRKPTVAALVEWLRRQRLAPRHAGQNRCG